MAPALSYTRCYKIPAPCYTKCTSCLRFGPTIEEHSTFHSKLKIKVEEYSTLVPKLQNSLITQNYSNPLLAVQTPYLHTCKFGQYNHDIYIPIQSVDSCHDEPFFLSHQMHPATQKLELLDSSGDSRFGVSECIWQLQI